MAAVAMAIAAIWIVDATTSLDPDPSVYPGVAMAIIALGVLVSVWWGRSRGLIAMGIVAGLFTAAAAFVGPGPYGYLVHDPSSADQVRPSYRLGVGALKLELQDVTDIEDLDGKATTIEARFGGVLVIIPSTVAATVNATVDHGDIKGAPTTQDRDNGGEHALLTPVADGRPEMTITVHLKYGEITIERAGCPGSRQPQAGESVKEWGGQTNVAAACN
jgi:hypothetical protein